VVSGRVELVLAAGARRRGWPKFSQRAFPEWPLDLDPRRGRSVELDSRPQPAGPPKLAMRIGRRVQRRIEPCANNFVEPAEWRPAVGFREDCRPRCDYAGTRWQLCERCAGRWRELVRSRQGRPVCVRLRVAIVEHAQCRQIQPAQMPQPRERAIVTTRPGPTHVT